MAAVNLARPGNQKRWNEAVTVYEEQDNSPKSVRRKLLQKYGGGQYAYSATEARDEAPPSMRSQDTRSKSHVAETWHDKLGGGISSAARAHHEAR